MAKQVQGEQLDAAYYDAKFTDNERAEYHYSRSNYYGLWTVIIDRLRQQPNPRILEIGCGPGQLAHAIRDMHIAESYIGLDFSQAAIDHARNHNPGLEFRCADVFEDRSLEDADYNIVLTTEFLEHVWEDLAVIERIRPGTVVIASVPNFPLNEHVRHFKTAQEVYDRYIPFFNELYVVTVRLHPAGLNLYLMQGKRRED